MINPLKTLRFAEKKCLHSSTWLDNRLLSTPNCCLKNKNFLLML